jgi:integrase
VRAYLNRYRDQPKTLRAYTKELERFLLWTVALRADAPSGPLLAPVIIPWTDASRQRHRKGQGRGALHVNEAGYTADGLNRLIGRMLTVLVETMDGLSQDERVRLSQANAHAFRHTFGTQSVADDVPVDVVQKVLGHASLQTTTIYYRQKVVMCSVEFRSQ